MFNNPRFQSLSAKYSLWPLWKKIAALSGLGIAAASLLIMPYREGQLKLGGKFGLEWTIVYAESPFLLVTVVAALEAILLFLTYALFKAFFPRSKPVQS